MTRPSIVRDGVRYALLGTLLTVLMGACGAGSGGRGADVSAADTVPTVPFEESSLVVIVSSQSYDRDEVTMQVEVDAHLVADQAFVTGSGHNNVSFPLDLEPGAHRVTVTADDGTTLDLPLDLPSQRRWLALSYWSGGEEGTYIDHKLFASTPGVG
jgi:hypothetical protein